MATATPYLKLWHHAELLPGLQQDSVPLRRLRQIQLGQSGSACRRRGDPPATDLRHHVHLAFGPLETLGAASVVVHEPFREPDGAFDRQPGIADALFQIQQTAATLDIVGKGIEPRLDGFKTCLGRDLDFFDDAQLLAANRRQIQTIAEWRGRRLGGRGGRRRPKSGPFGENHRANEQAGTGQGLAA